MLGMLILSLAGLAAVKAVRSLRTPKKHSPRLLLLLEAKERERNLSMRSRGKTSEGREANDDHIEAFNLVVGHSRRLIYGRTYREFCRCAICLAKGG